MPLGGRIHTTQFTLVILVRLAIIGDSGVFVYGASGSSDAPGLGILKYTMQCQAGIDPVLIDGNTMTA